MNMNSTAVIVVLLYMVSHNTDMEQARYERAFIGSRDQHGVKDVGACADGTCFRFPSAQPIPIPPPLFTHYPHSANATPPLQRTGPESRSEIEKKKHFFVVGLWRRRMRFGWVGEVWTRIGCHNAITYAYTRLLLSLGAAVPMFVLGLQCVGGLATTGDW
jgi:hypothetical protein